VTQRGSGIEARPEERRRSSGLVVSLLILTFASLAAAQWHSKQTIDRVEIIGASDLSISSVQPILDSCLRAKRQALTLAEVRERVESVPFVRAASVYFSGVRGLTAEIEERRPVAHVVLTDGSLRYVDNTGTILPPSDRRTMHCVPLVRTAWNVIPSAAQLAGFVDVLGVAESTLETSLYQSISEVILERDGTLRVLTDRATWRLGRPDPDEARRAFADMNVFWERMSSRPSMAGSSLIDLRWRHHIVLRQHSSTPTAS
jgi:hypothetical protein